MKLIFMGTPDFSVGTLEALIAAGHEITLVVSQPDKPKGRGHELQPTPVKEIAIKHGLKVFQPRKLRDPKTVAVLEHFGRRNRCDCFRADCAGVYPSYEKIRLYQCTCFSSSEIQRSGSDSVGCYRRRGRERRDDYADGRRA